MIQRQHGPFKRFLLTFFGWCFRIFLLVLLYVVVSFAILRGTASSRAVTLHTADEAPSAPQVAPDSLRLCAYNIAHGRGKGLNASNFEGGTLEEKRARLQAIGDTLRELQLDIVVLNEVDFHSVWSYGLDQADIIAEAGGFPYVVKQRNLDTGVFLVRRYCFGNVVLSRFPVTEAEIVRFPPLSHFENVFAGNHDGVLTSIQIGENESISVLGVHLEVRSEDVRVQAASQIVELQRDLTQPLIAMGDFNSTLPGFPDSKSSSTGQNALEVLDSFGNFSRRPIRGRASHETFTYPTTGPRRIIDWILPDHSWTFMQYKALQNIDYSDHVPVIASIRKR